MPMPWGMKIAIIAIPTLTVLAIIPEVRLAGLAMLGRTDQCSFKQAVGSFRTLRDRYRRIEAIRASARLLQTDDMYGLWRTRDGDFWIPKRNPDALFQNLAEQEQDVYGIGATGVHSGDTVLDCGANIGVYTRKALDAGARTVVAIEPAPENVECLRRNFAKEVQTGRVLIQAVGVWNEAGKLPLTVDAGNSARDSFVLSFGPAASVVTIPLVTIDSLVSGLSLDRVDFIKMDIEGAEKKAIAGAANTLARFHPRLAVAMEHLADDPVAIPAVINSMRLDYATICGLCLDLRETVRPDVLYFVKP
jgi:FkbM family methyltransferase